MWNAQHVSVRSALEDPGEVVDKVAQSLQPELPGLPRPHRLGNVTNAPPEGLPWIRVQTLGATRMLIGDQIVSAQSEMIFAILLRLVYAPAMRVPRDVLLVELWPGQPNTRQRANLRQALYKLRGLQVDIALRAESVQLNRDQILRTFSIERNLESFDRDVTRGDEPFGLFLPGLVGCSTAFDSWLERMRESVHADVRRVLVEVLRQRRERADWGAAEILSRWLLQFDPLNEDATLTLAECTMMAGAKAEAVAMLDRYLAELGPHAGDIRLPAQLLKKRFSEPATRRRSSLATTERHFVGREQDLAELTMSMRRARWHDGSAVMLHGPSGIGKSRLLSELAKVAQIEGYREVSIECRETDLQRPLSVFLEALPELLSTPGALGCAPESMTVLKRLVGDGIQTNTSSDRSTDDAESPTPRLEIEASIDIALRTIRAQSIRHSVLDLFAAVSDEQPLLLSIDDIHWLDDASWELLSDLVHRVRATRIFLIATSRYPSIRSERPARVPIELVFRRLPALSRESCLRLTRAISDDLAALPSEEVENWLVSSSEGTPLMLRALIDHWIVTGNATGVPPTLVGLIEQRLDRLIGEGLRALQTIGLLGRYASLDRIQATLQLPVHVLLHALEQLEQAGCLASSDAALVISHELVAKIAKMRLSALVESALRGSICDALEAEYLQTLEYPILLEALRHLELSSRPDALHRFVMRHEAVLLNCGHPVPVLSAVLKLRGTNHAPHLNNRTAHILSRLEIESGEFGAALQITPGAEFLPKELSALGNREIDQALTFVESAYRSDPIVDRSELGLFSATVAGSLLISTELRMRAADIGLIIAANTCDAELADSCYHSLHLVPSDLSSSLEARRIGLLFHSVFGSVDTADSLAMAIYERALVAPVSSNTITDCSRAGYVFRMTGRTHSAMAAFHRALEAANELGSPRRKEFPLWQLSLLALDSGDIAGAERWTQQLSGIALSNGEDTANDYLYGHLCLLAIATENDEEATHYLHACRRSLPSLPPIRSTAFTIGLELGTKLLDRSWLPEPGLLDVAIDRFKRTARFCAADFLAATIGECLLRNGDTNVARTMLANYLSTERRERCDVSARLARILAQLEPIP